MPPITTGNPNTVEWRFDIKRLKDLEEENRRLKQMYAELSLDHKILKHIVEKKL